MLIVFQWVKFNTSVYTVLLIFNALSIKEISNFTVLGSKNNGFAAKFIVKKPEIDLCFPGGVKYGTRSCWFPYGWFKVGLINSLKLPEESITRNLIGKL